MSDREKLPRRWAGYFGIGALLFILGAYGLFACMWISEERARRANCLSNLKQIGVAIGLYVQDQKAYPENLVDLYPGYLSDLRALRCHSDSNKTDRGLRYSSYVYQKPKADRPGANEPLVVEKRGNHLDVWTLKAAQGVLYASGKAQLAESSGDQ